jgi:hypothetical protein
LNAPEARVIADFRARYHELSADLAAFERAYRAAPLGGLSVDDIGAWCAAWWEQRLGARILDHGERRLRGTQDRN